MSPFYDTICMVSKDGIEDVSGRVPDYTICVVLAKYFPMCPDEPYSDTEWLSFKDFKKTSHFLNLNFFASDTERAIIKSFSDKIDLLSKSCEKLEGFPHEMQVSYDLSVRFDAFPRISLLLLFNDSDDEFPAKCSVLFQRQAEH